MKRAQIKRDKHGTPHVYADRFEDLLWGLGYVQAMDRGLQLLLMRILGQGRGSECLEASTELLALDRFFRRMHWSKKETQEASFSAETSNLLEAYCSGINARFNESIPWELRLLNYKPEPWTLDDILLFSRMIPYLSLTQAQTEIERLFLEMLQAGVNRQRLDELFPGLLGGLDEELLRKIKLTETIVPASVKWNAMIPRLMASNNWVISGAKTASGKPILANDPHLETNRLPNIWQEVALIAPHRYAIGATMPGIPGIHLGRTNDVSWGATYAFMDSVDSWVEHCRNGMYKRETPEGEKWLPFHTRKELIKRKKQTPHEEIFFENEHGVLDGDPSHGESFRLATRWSGENAGPTSLNAMMRLWNASTTEEAMECLGQLEAPFSWCIADRHGNIGFQMSGLLPKRRQGISGFIPVPGWKPENDWQGIENHRELPRALNPREGFFVTANNDLNDWGNTKASNIPMGDYRAQRITHLLSTHPNPIKPEDIYKMHTDVFSIQAEQFMLLIKPLLPDTKAGRILASWDLHYSPSSQGAFLFERIYHELMHEVFGAQLGEAFNFLKRETSTFIGFFANFDRILLSETSTWFQGRDRNDILRAAITRGLTGPVRKWGTQQKFKLSHMLFGGKLPSFLGFDRGPITLPGGRATIHQNQIYRSGGRVTSFAPSFRMVVDMSEPGTRTNLAGGPSDRRFSRWYCSDLKNWRLGRYKKLGM